MTELESELQQVESVDEDTRHLLEQAVGEIQSILERRQPEDTPETGLIDSLREAEQKFETSHPTISGILLRMVDALGQMGI